MADPLEDSSRDDQDPKRELFRENDFDDESEDPEPESSLEGHVGVVGSSSCKGQPAPASAAAPVTAIASLGGNTLPGVPPNTATDAQRLASAVSPLE
ncbi:hypothetical protein TWF694_003038 [Orbilia ellipsospora]|uniref:Uncharacterized protein n=1 Tax=Orbilia ellipsospora TaxID=2528407 RepID=A0AAV9X0R8_9PEZI